MRVQNQVPGFRRGIFFEYFFFSFSHLMKDFKKTVNAVRQDARARSFAGVVVFYFYFICFNFYVFFSFFFFNGLEIIILSDCRKP